MTVSTAPNFQPGHGNGGLFYSSQSSYSAPLGGGTAPQFVSAEIGTINAFTLPVTFDMDISASNYATGVTIKVNGTATSITSATRQANHAVVRYVIPVLWHGAGDTVTWEYASGSGNVVSEADATPLADVSAQVVTNNIVWSSSDWQVDSGVTTTVSSGAGSGTITQSGNTITGDSTSFTSETQVGSHIVAAGIDGYVTGINGDTELLLSTSATVAIGVPYTITTTRIDSLVDQSGNGNDFSQSTISRKPVLAPDDNGDLCVLFDSYIDYPYLVGPDFGDNANSFSVMVLSSVQSFADNIVLCKSSTFGASYSMMVIQGGARVEVIGDIATEDFSCAAQTFADSVKRVFTTKVIDTTIPSADVYRNGVSAGTLLGTGALSYSNAEPMRIGSTGDFFGVSYMRIYGMLRFAPIPGATDQAALETRLGARYGLTVP